MLDCIHRRWDENDILRRYVRCPRLGSVPSMRFVPISPELLHPSMTEPSSADIPLRAEIGRKLLHLLALVIPIGIRSEEHTSELQSRGHLVCRLLLEKKK